MWYLVNHIQEEWRRQIWSTSSQYYAEVWSRQSIYNTYVSSQTPNPVTHPPPRSVRAEKRQDDRNLPVMNCLNRVNWNSERKCICTSHLKSLANGKDDDASCLMIISISTLFQHDLSSQVIFELWPADGSRAAHCRCYHDNNNNACKKLFMLSDLALLHIFTYNVRIIRSAVQHNKCITESGNLFLSMQCPTSVEATITQ